MTNSPIFEEFKTQVRVTVSDGSQTATDFDLVIFDGDGFTGKQVQSENLIREAINSGVWVLGLDIEEEDNRGLGEMLHSSSHGEAGAYLVRRSTTGDQATSRLIDFANPERKPSASPRGSSRISNRRSHYSKSHPVTFQAAP